MPENLAIYEHITGATVRGNRTHEGITLRYEPDTVTVNSGAIQFMPEHAARALHALLGKLLEGV